MSRATTSSLLVSVLLGLAVSGGAAAAPPSSPYRASDMIVMEATATFDAGLLTLSGLRFDPALPVEVTWGDAALPLAGCTVVDARLAFCDLPPDLLPGTYQVLVTNDATRQTRGIAWITVGAQGPGGPRGPVGLDGATGAVGPQGPVGLVGAQGPVGPVGSMGVSGATGPTGPTGPVGLAGATGEAGPTGPVGAVGPDGPEGAAGPVGAEGPAGISGGMGPTGPRGLSGPIGPDGSVGPQGPAGAPSSATLDLATTLAQGSNGGGAKLVGVGTMSFADLDCAGCASGNDILDGNVTSSKIADGSVATEDLRDNAVRTETIVDGTVTRSDLSQEYFAVSVDCNGDCTTMDTGEVCDLGDAQLNTLYEFKPLTFSCMYGMAATGALENWFEDCNANDDNECQNVPLNAGARGMLRCADDAGADAVVTCIQTVVAR